MSIIGIGGAILGSSIGKKLIPILIKAGAGKLAQAVGSDTLAGEVITRVGAALGTGPDPVAIERKFEADPEGTAATIREVEATMPPEYWLLLSQESAARIALLTKEHEEPWWAWAWRPGAMWLIGLFWFWMVLVIPVLGMFRVTISLVVDAATLMALTGLYMGLYMGGHTVKESIKEWKETRTNEAVAEATAKH